MIEKIKKRYAKIINAQIEYETQHPDAGGNYWHCIGEGAYDYYNRGKALREWIGQTCGVDDELLVKRIDAQIGSDPLDTAVIDLCEPEPGHIFSAGSDVGKFQVASFPVQEVESSVEACEDYHALNEQEADVINKWMRAEHCAHPQFRQYEPGKINNWYCYQASDAVWQFFAKRADIISAIWEIAEYHDIDTQDL